MEIGKADIINCPQFVDEETRTGIRKYRGKKRKKKNMIPKERPDSVFV